MPRRFRILIVAIITLAGVAGAFVTSRTLAQTPPTPGSATYRYDSLGRVVQDIYPANSAAYSYDAADNRTSFTQH
jgi:YD repeat-containing protein